MQESKYGHVRTYGGVSNAYSRIRTVRARVHGCGWVGTEKLRHPRVHGEATECVVFIGRAWTEQAMETRPGVPQNGGNGLVFDRPRSKQVEEGHSGATRQGRVLRGVGRALHPRGQVVDPPPVFLVPNILKYSRKNHI